MKPTFSPFKSGSIRSFRCRSERGRGFTLIEVLVAVGVLAVLAAIVLSVFGRAQIPVRRAECDVHLKEIALAADTFRQERGRMPKDLNELLSQQYISADTLRCPSDPDYDNRHASDPNYTSYGDSYVIREPRDSGELPIVVCPFHEKDGGFGVQAYKGGYTKGFSARPATLNVGDFSGTVTISRPGEGILSLPTAAGKPLLLRGGDKIQVGAGLATIRFEDGSTANIEANSQMSVMQSFIEGQRSATLYTLVRQVAGRVNYYVNPGSHFDVATPTATAGALGTRFTLDVTPAYTLAGTSNSSTGQSQTVLTVTEHTVALTTVDRTIEISDEEPAIAANSAAAKNKQRKPRESGSIGKSKSKDKDKDKNKNDD